MSYRENSFRDLPTAPELPDDQPSATPEEIAELVATLEARLVHFETSSWVGIAKEIQSQMMADQARLGGIGSYTNEQIRELRGRVQALSWILNLPEQIRMDLKQRFDQLHDIAKRNDEGEESEDA
jgi:hypothetical protein